ncbi:MAG: hypothetical protein ACRC8S_20615 [Fimbriiglobus sp.]
MNDPQNPIDSVPVDRPIVPRFGGMNGLSDLPDLPPISIPESRIIPSPATPIPAPSPRVVVDLPKPSPSIRIEPPKPSVPPSPTAEVIPVPPAPEAKWVSEALGNLFTKRRAALGAAGALVFGALGMQLILGTKASTLTTKATEVAAVATTPPTAPTTTPATKGTEPEPKTPAENPADSKKRFEIPLPVPPNSENEPKPEVSPGLTVISIPSNPSASNTTSPPAPTVPQRLPRTGDPKNDSTKTPPPPSFEDPEALRKRNGVMTAGHQEPAPMNPSGPGPMATTVGGSAPGASPLIPVVPPAMGPAVAVPALPAPSTPPVGITPPGVVAPAPVTPVPLINVPSVAPITAAVPEVKPIVEIGSTLPLVTEPSLAVTALIGPTLAVTKPTSKPVDLATTSTIPEQKKTTFIKPQGGETVSPMNTGLQTTAAFDPKGGTTPPPASLGIVVPGATPPVPDPKNTATGINNVGIIQVPPPITEPKPLPMTPEVPKIIPPAPLPGGSGSPFTEVQPLAVKPMAPVLEPVRAANTRTSFDVDVYQAQPNESYDSISRRHYGNEVYARALQEFNGNRVLRPGDYVELPPLAEMRRRTGRVVNGTPTSNPTPAWNATPGTPAPSKGRQYRIPRDGMTLFDVADAVYNDRTQYRAIRAANPDRDPNAMLKTGDTINLPAAR